MELVQRNSAAELLAINETGLAVTSVDGMPDRLALTIKGRTPDGVIKPWQLTFDSFAEIERLQAQLDELRPYAGQVSDVHRALMRDEHAGSADTERT